VPVEGLERSRSLVPVQERNKTVDELLLNSLERQFETLEELLDRCLPTVAARLWATCSWAESMSEGWKIGDYTFLILAAIPEPEAQIYIQFWSEPHEPVVAEVSSGEWSPGTLKYVRASHRRQLKAFGFQIGGRASNFRKEIQISTAQEAEIAARETLQILFDVFGYRGQWPLTLKRHEGQRANIEHTYTSLTPEDFAKLALAGGWRTRIVAEQAPAEDVRAVLLRRGSRESIAILEDRVPKNNLYTSIRLQTRFLPGATDQAVQRVNADLRFVRARQREGVWVLDCTLTLAGGVTAEWLLQALSRWHLSCRAADSLARRQRTRPRAQKKRVSQAVH
jgi:hypothetical protein